MKLAARTRTPPHSTCLDNALPAVVMHLYHLVHTLCRNGVLSTIASHPGSAGFPFGSVVEFAVDDAGYPLLSTSTLSPHTADLQADGRCSITVMAPGFTVSAAPSAIPCCA